MAFLGEVKGKDLEAFINSGADGWAGRDCISPSCDNVLARLHTSAFPFSCSLPDDGEKPIQ